MEPIETSNSGANQAVLHAQKDISCLGPIETCFSVPKVAVVHPKTTDEGEDPWRLVFQFQTTLFSCTKRQAMSGTHRDLLFRS